MKISQLFSLGKTQPQLDFVDIAPTADTPLFLDPFFMSRRQDPWAMSASRTIADFFTTIVGLIHDDKPSVARALFSNLHERNETCLGMSKGRPQGRGLGSGDEARIFDSLLQSRAVQSGVVTNLEDCNLFVPNFGPDKLSDMVTNIIKRHLVSYTQHQCRLVGIPLAQGVPTGPFWDSHSQTWNNEHSELPVVEGNPIILVPKGIVSYSFEYMPQRYYQHFVLNFLQRSNLQRHTSLVRTRTDGVTRFVTKSSIQETEAPYSKEFLQRFTTKHPEVFAQFRQQTANSVRSLTHQELSADDIPALAEYLRQLLHQIPPGAARATDYHRFIAGILELIFYPYLQCPQIEYPIHEGRKRIDITFDNAARDGFFYRLHTTHKIPSAYIVVECKNYSADPDNPELDQLAGRFSINRGQAGLLMCRRLDDDTIFLRRCTDTYKDGRGLILPFTDEDLDLVLRTIAHTSQNPVDELLSNKLRLVALA